MCWSSVWGRYRKTLEIFEKGPSLQMEGRLWPAVSRTRFRSSFSRTSTWSSGLLLFFPRVCTSSESERSSACLSLFLTWQYCSCNIRYLLSPFWSLYWPKCWLNMYRWIWALGWISFFRSLPEAHDHYRWELERRPTGYISTALL